MVLLLIRSNQLIILQQNVKHQFITPYWPRANGEVERFMRCLNKLFRTIKVEKKIIKVELQSFLRNNRSTPHSTSGPSPASLLQKSSAQTNCK
jgi:hypothetical protein